MNYSRQREAIKEYLLSTKEHPTADIIYQNVKASNPKISLATVYRNLSTLVDAREIKKISSGDGNDHFDADIHPHSHYVCRCCKKILDVEVTCSAEQVLAASGIGLGSVESAEIIFSGICNNCKSVVN